MKNLARTFAILFAFLTIACSDDNSSNSTISITEAVDAAQNGTWRISLFAEDLDEQTHHFTGYVFTFGDDNLLTATDGTNTYTGFWSVTNSGSDSSGDVDFNISFTSPDHFAELTADWQIIEVTDTHLRLEHVSGGDGSIDSLTFVTNN